MLQITSSSLWEGSSQLCGISEPQLALFRRSLDWVKMLQNQFLHELCHFSASVNSILPPNRYMFNILSFLMSVACTCMHTLTFLSNSQNVFFQPSKHTTTNHGKHSLLSVRKKRQSIHPINKSSQNKSNFTHVVVCFCSSCASRVWASDYVQIGIKSFAYFKV